jgi:4'-phosphopantetheinyl transferase
MRNTRPDLPDPDVSRKEDLLCAISHWEPRQEPPPLEKSVHIWRLFIPVARVADAGLSPSASPLPFLQNNDTTRPGERLAAFLTPEERERAGRYRFEADRHRFAHARGLLRYLLGHYTGRAPQDVRFETGPMGKLHVSSPQVYFNLSHSHEWALIAISRDRDVGVDVEHHRPLHHALFAIADRFFAPVEVEALRALPEDQHHPAFYRIWSRKEAFIKATGQGVSAGLDTFAVSIGTDAEVSLRVFKPAGDEARWIMRSLDMGAEYGAAVCVERRGDADDIDLKLWEWNETSRGE